MARTSFTDGTWLSVLVIGSLVLVAAGREERPALPSKTLRVILPVPTECPKKESENQTVHLAHESDCTKFYKCAWGRKVLQECPCDEYGSRLYFNKEEQVCDWSFNVECEPKDPNEASPCPELSTKPNTPTPSTKETTPAINTPTPATNTPTPATNTPTPATNTTTPATNTTTPATNTPTPATNKTTPATNKTTPATNTPTPATNTPTPATDPTPGPVPDPLGCLGNCPNDDPPNRITALPHTECNKWCRCEGNKAKVIPCPADLHFSPKLKICTSPEKAGCAKGTKADQASKSLFQSLFEYF